MAGLLLGIDPGAAVVGSNGESLPEPDFGDDVEEEGSGAAPQLFDYTPWQ